ncbi:glycosyltransferase [Phaeobacter marinintestinus]|uniref:glycosyltransferase n=1 Tax=Falsiphaeobacter marinintestinus TaxID=1492905 RepID=UPI001644A0D4|nr:glycosyltransferase [Phaeobacter marinintestinus]
MNHIDTPFADPSYVMGNIDTVSSKEISGWVACVEADILPVLFVNGRPAELIEWQRARTDVNHALGLPGNMGFAFSAQGVTQGDVIELFIFDGKKISFVLRKIAPQGCGYDDLLLQILEAKEISQQPDCVAVTCWDGAHNPLGRAHVLYQVIKTQRPAVLVSFLFDEFGGKIWPPLEGADLKRLMIPWGRRHEAYDMMARLDLSFPTVWMCKPRQPTFELTANLINSDTRLVLDHDDNEVFFANSSGGDKVYGKSSVSLARYLQSKITAHTAASVSLADELDAGLARHARVAARTPAPKETKSDTIKIGFIGTVRPHKGMVEAARAIKITGWHLKREIEFHVYGMFQPVSLADELADLGVIVKQNIAGHDLQKYLEEFDVILTGFPSGLEEDSDITRYQISSKIGDALAIGRPALIPMSASVADLWNYPGAILFTADKFSEALLTAIETKDSVSLPRDFTLEGVYDVFEKAEKVASPPPFEMRALKAKSPAKPKEAKPTLLLIWKQSDSGLYGRRIDQVARSYKSRYPGHRVVILELHNAHDQAAMAKNAQGFSHEAKIILPLIEQKLARTYIDRFGVEHHGLGFANSHVIKGEFSSYLVSEAFLPENTKIVLFPIVPSLEKIYGILSAYRCVVDVVDNQFSWASGKSRLKMGGQYHALLKMAKGIVLNSPETLAFLKAGSFLSPAHCEEPFSTIIPNWYSNDQIDFNGSSKAPGCHLVYSGNMNDRIDWKVLAEVADLDPDVTLHLAGTATRVGSKLSDLTERENVVYWGPLLEHQVTELLLNARAGLMPHVRDDVSSFMNPIKIQMYRAHGLPVIASDVPGIDPDEVVLCKTPTAFLDSVSQVIASSKDDTDSEALRDAAFKTARERADQYIDVLNALY